MKSANKFSVRTLADRIMSWHRRIFPDVRDGWRLYTATWKSASGISAVLLVLPYVLLAFYALRTVSFDVYQGMQLMTGMGYVSDFGGMMYNQMRALSSYSSLLSYAVELILLPCACAAFASIFGTRWRGANPNFKQIWAELKPRMLRIIMTGVMVLFTTNIVRFAVNIVTGLLSMIASLFGFIPFIGMVLYAVVYIVSILLTLALGILMITLLMFAMYNNENGNAQGFQSIMETVRIVWGGRRDILPGLIWLLVAAALMILADVLIYAALSAVFGIAVGISGAIILIAAAAVVAIPAMCAYLTVLYMNEKSRTGGRPFVYTDFINNGQY